MSKRLVNSEEKRPHRLAWPRTPDFQSDNGGSNPPGVNNISVRDFGQRYFFCALQVPSIRLEMPSLLFQPSGSSVQRIVLVRYASISCSSQFLFHSFNHRAGLSGDEIAIQAVVASQSRA